MTSTRYEVKMICEEMYLPDVRAWVNMHSEMFVEAYPLRQVNSLYFDTRQADSLNDNLIGISERSKLRFRWYGTDYSSVTGNLELKCKSNQLGWKMRYAIPFEFDLTTWTWTAFVQQVRVQVDGLFAAWLLATDQPVLINSCMREYHESIDHQVRVTVDRDVASYEQVMYAAPNLLIQAPPAHQVIVEVKCDAGLHRRLSDVLSSFPFQVTRHSKYVDGLTRSLRFT